MKPPVYEHKAGKNEVKRSRQSSAKPEVIRRHSQTDDQPDTHESPIDPTYAKKDFPGFQRRCSHPCMQSPDHSGTDRDDNGLRDYQERVRHRSAFPCLERKKKRHRVPRLKQLCEHSNAEQEQERRQDKRIDATGASIRWFVRIHDAILGKQRTGAKQTVDEFAGRRRRLPIGNCRKPRSVFLKKTPSPSLIPSCERSAQSPPAPDLAISLKEDRPTQSARWRSESNAA